jgi:hypothetical protein
LLVPRAVIKDDFRQVARPGCAVRISGIATYKPRRCPPAIHATRDNLIGKVVITGSPSPDILSTTAGPAQRAQARVLACSVEGGLSGPRREDFWNEPKIRSRAVPREGHSGVLIRFSSTQVRALLLAPSIQRFPLDIPPGRKQDDDRALKTQPGTLCQHNFHGQRLLQHRNGRERGPSTHVRWLKVRCHQDYTPVGVARVDPKSK